MKKFLPVILATVMVFSLSGCGFSQSLRQGDEQPAASPDATRTNILIAYFSMPENVNTDGVDAISGSSIVVKDGTALGNVQYIANLIQENTSGELFQINTEHQYALDHGPLLDQAEEELDSDARPALSSHVENMDDYDIIFLGYPIWWADLPMPLYTFLEEYDLSGKTIIPFSPHGGSGFSGTESTIAQLQPEATVSEQGFTVSRDDVTGCADDVIAWLQTLNLAD